MDGLQITAISPLELHRYNTWLDNANSFSMFGSSTIANSRSTLAWVVRQTDSDLGVVVIEVDTDNHGYLRIGVNPHERRKGLGYLIAEQALKLPDIDNIRSLRALISPSNTAALKIVRKYEFSKIGTSETGQDIYEHRSKIY